MIRLGFLFMILLLGADSFAQAKDSCSCEKFATAKKSAEEKYAGWKVVSLFDLDKDDKEIWTNVNSESCPGIVEGSFDGDRKISYAITLLKIDGKKKYQMLVVEKGGRWVVLSKPENVYRVSVVRRLPPGKYDLQKKGMVEVKNPMIIYEAIEAGALAYFWKNGRYHEAVGSD